ncbi:MAG: hypothetical protein ABIA11_00705 [Patescibacteria group bacterium]
MNLFTLFGKKKLSRSISKNTEDLIQREWKQIDTLLSGKSPSQLRQALISADKTLDNALRDLFDGNTLGDRLKLSDKKFDRYLYDDIWKAHKLRNNLVHESGFEPTHFVITEAIQTLRRALQTLGVRV